MDIIYNIKQNKIVGFSKDNLEIGGVSNSHEKKLLVIDADMPIVDEAIYNLKSYWTADLINLTYTKAWEVIEKTVEEKQQYLKEQEEKEKQKLENLSNLETNNNE